MHNTVQHHRIVCFALNSCKVCLVISLFVFKPEPLCTETKLLLRLINKWCLTFSSVLFLFSNLEVCRVREVSAVCSFKLCISFTCISMGFAICSPKKNYDLLGFLSWFIFPSHTESGDIFNECQALNGSIFKTDFAATNVWMETWGEVPGRAITEVQNQKYSA